MSVCKYCGREIDWVHTDGGKMMPIDLDAVFVIEGEGNEIFITDEEGTITGREARPEEERRELPVAFVPHWRTCTNAMDFRRGARR